MVANLVHPTLRLKFAIALRAFYHAVVFIIVLGRLSLASRKPTKRPYLIPSYTRREFTGAFAAFEVWSGIGIGRSGVRIGRSCVRVGKSGIGIARSGVRIWRSGIRMLRMYQWTVAGRHSKETSTILAASGLGLRFLPGR